MTKKIKLIFKFIIIFLISCTFIYLVIFLFKVNKSNQTNSDYKTSANRGGLLSNLSNENISVGQKSYSFKSSSGVELKYLFYVPESYDPYKKWPLIVFLQGDGQRGDSPEILKNEYIPQLLEVNNDLPTLVVSPLLISGRWADHLEIIEELVDYLINTLPIDSNRLYLTGLSVGGFDTWLYALSYPNRFAAIAPVAGGYIQGNPDTPPNICDIKKIWVWTFHGDSDDNVKLYQTININMVDALKKCGGKRVKFTLYEQTEHIYTWHKAYEDENLWKWLLSKSKDTQNNIREKELLNRNYYYFTNRIDLIKITPANWHW